MTRISDKKYLGTIIFPLFCLLLSFLILLTDSHFTYSLLEKNESIQPTKELMNYFIGKGQMPEVFNTEEKSHLQDVKELIRYAVITFLLTIIALIYCGFNPKAGTILLIILLAASIIMPFDTLFTKFHQIFFPQGNWTFPPESTLIQFYPASFFATYGLSIGIFALFISLLFSIAVLRLDFLSPRKLRGEKINLARVKARR